MEVTTTPAVPSSHKALPKWVVLPYCNGADDLKKKLTDLTRFLFLFPISAEWYMVICTFPHTFLVLKIPDIFYKKSEFVITFCWKCFFKNRIKSDKDLVTIRDPPVKSDTVFGMAVLRDYQIMSGVSRLRLVAKAKKSSSRVIKHRHVQEELTS